MPRGAGLPDDVEAAGHRFLVARVGGRGALFRSLAVAPAARGLGLAHRLPRAREAAARARGAQAAYLLTATIEPLAARWGFTPIERSCVPDAIQATWEFRGTCCGSAIPMWRDLTAPSM